MQGVLEKIFRYLPERQPTWWVSLAYIGAVALAWMCRVTLPRYIMSNFVACWKFRLPGESAGPCDEERRWQSSLDPHYRGRPCRVAKVFSPAFDGRHGRPSKKTISIRCSSAKHTCSAIVVDTRTHAHSSLTQHLHAHRPAVARHQRQGQWRKKTYSPCTCFTLLSLSFSLRPFVCEKKKTHLRIYPFFIGHRDTEKKPIVFKFCNTAVDLSIKKIKRGTTTTATTPVLYQCLTSMIRCFCLIVARIDVQIVFSSNRSNVVARPSGANHRNWRAINPLPSATTTRIGRVGCPPTRMDCWHLHLSHINHRFLLLFSFLLSLTHTHSMFPLSRKGDVEVLCTRLYLGLWYGSHMWTLCAMHAKIWLMRCWNLLHCE